MATSAFAGNSRSGQAMAEINITPLVDVMLVLLIIFMVAAPMVTGSLDIRLPQSPPPGPEQIKPARINLSVQADGSYLLDGVALSERALQAALGDVARAAPNTIVAIAANQDADYQAFTGALTAARRSGITNIALEQP